MRSAQSPPTHSSTREATPSYCYQDVAQPIRRSYDYDDVYRLTLDSSALVDWLTTRGVIGDFEGACPRCTSGQLTRKKDSSYGRDGLVWRCRVKTCGQKVSIREGSWFSGSHLTLPQLMKHLYYWVYKTPSHVIQRELRIGSCHTLVDWNMFCREVCMTVIEADSSKIGGPGTTVEIDESKFGKRKYHRGKRVEGVWVLGGIERESRQVFLTTLTDRSADTLISAIEKHVAKGTTIITDCWKAYNKLGKLGYTHMTVNHSENFKDPETGAHTNTIESTWRAVKNTGLPGSGTQKALYDSYFVEYIFWRKYLSSAPDKYLAFLEAVKRVYPPTLDCVVDRLERKPLAEKM
ncbi:uncharacterized protein LOC124281755 [Haliotis rubra]|uniref:uncharacterized protein LOC124281755 n=1 Tax=Haliotis rubra TaxID=36100 RepID=UPI001EE61ADF|nr:uncharacterized protein LOC124281755 [Haliotis rubra]